MLNVKQSYVFAQQQGLLNRIGNFFSGNPDNQQQVYVLAQQKIQTAARQSPLLAEAQRNTTSMLTGMMHSLGFQQVTVTYAAPATQQGLSGRGQVRACAGRRWPPARRCRRRGRLPRPGPRRPDRRGNR